MQGRQARGGIVTCILCLAATIVIGHSLTIDQKDWTQEYSSLCVMLIIFLQISH